MHQAPIAHKIAIAAPHAAAVDAAAAVVAEGGSVIDGAITAAAVLTVVYPHMCSLGGDLIAIVRSPNGDQNCINSTGAYGSKVPIPTIIKYAPTLPVTGPLTVSVPGTVAGWNAIHRTWGRLPLRRLLAPAIHLAECGTVVSPGLAEAISIDTATLKKDAGMSAVFFPDGGPLTAGSLLVQPALAQTLRLLANEGLQSFYQGSVADILAAGFDDLDVPITRADLAAHHARTEQPLRRRVADWTVSTAGPNSQGYTMLRTLGALNIHRPADVADVDPALLAELLGSGDRLRDDRLADPRFAAVDVDGALQPEALNDARREAEASVLTGVRGQAIRTPRPGGDTIAVTAVAHDGTAISLIQSVFHSFGSQILEPRTGAVLHNRASFFRTEPSAPNVIAAGKRPAHTLMPVLLEKDDGTIAAHGTMGGKAQAQIHTQLFLRTLGGANPTEAVTAPRIIVGDPEHGAGEDDRLMIEPGIPDAIVARLAETSFRLRLGQPHDPDAGHAMIARRGPDGQLEAGADPRSDGSDFVGPA